MLNISDLKTDLQDKFECVDTLVVSRTYLQGLNQTIKTLTRLLKMRIRTDLPGVSITQFQDTMTDLLKIAKAFESKEQEWQTQSLRENKRNKTLEDRISYLEADISAQLQALTTQNQALQEQKRQLQTEIELKEQEYHEKLQAKLKEFEIDIKKIRHERDQLKSQNSNLQSLIKQLKEEKGSHLEIKLKTIKEEVAAISKEYQKKLESRDIYIEKLERELKLVKSEAEMSQDLILLSSSKK